MRKIFSNQKNTDIASAYRIGNASLQHPETGSMLYTIKDT